MQKTNDTTRTSIARVEREVADAVTGPHPAAPPAAATAETVVTMSAEPAEPIQWHTEVGDLLAQAAVLCVQHGVDVDTFMKGAWSAYVESRPGMREYIEEMQLRTQLDELRRQGRLGEA